jgi:hypothetical protein
MKYPIEQNSDWLTEQQAYEIVRLEAILRNPSATQTDRTVATEMLKSIREVR